MSTNFTEQRGGIQQGRLWLEHEAAPKPEIKQGDIVYLTTALRPPFTVFRQPGGELNTDDSKLQPRMGYLDHQKGFIVQSLQTGGMAEIKPVKYTYPTDKGKTFLVSVDNLKPQE